MVSQDDIADCFDLNHSTLAQLLVNSLLIASYCLYHFHVLHSCHEKCKGQVILAQLK